MASQNTIRIRTGSQRNDATAGSEANLAQFRRHRPDTIWGRGAAGIVCGDVTGTRWRRGGYSVRKIQCLAVADYTTNLNGPHRETIEGNLGIRITW